MDIKFDSDELEKPNTRVTGDKNHKAVADCIARKAFPLHRVLYRGRFWTATERFLYMINLSVGLGQEGDVHRASMTRCNNAGSAAETDMAAKRLTAWGLFVMLWQIESKI